jgi:predicted MFS family arabinose efflux permease
MSAPASPARATPAGAPRAAPPPTAVAVLYASALVQGLTIVSFPAGSAVLKAVHGLTDAQYGALFLPQVAAAVAGSVAGARVARTLGLRRLLWIALAVNALSQALLAGADLLPHGLAAPCVLLAATVLGLGFGLSGAPLNAMPALLFPRRTDSAIVALHALLGVGLALGPVAAHAFAATGAWRAFPATLALGALALAWAAAHASLPARAPDAPGTEPFAGPEPAGAAAFRLYVAVAFLYALAEGTLANWAVLYLRETQELPAAAAAAALSAFWAGIVTGRVATSVVVLRIEPVRVWLALPAPMTLAFLLLPGARTPGLALAAFGFAGLACSAFFPLTVGRAAARFPGQAAWVAAMLTAALMLGIGVGSWSVGLLRGALSMETIYRLCALYPVAALVLAAASVRPAR